MIDGPFRISVCFALLAHAASGTCVAAALPGERSQRIDSLEQQLLTARHQLQELQRTIDVLALELSELRSSQAVPTTNEQPATERQTALLQPSTEEERPAADYRHTILVPALGEDERAQSLKPRPELFVQSRYHANPIDEAAHDDVTRNFGLNLWQLDGQKVMRMLFSFELEAGRGLTGVCPARDEAESVERRCAEPGKRGETTK